MDGSLVYRYFVILIIPLVLLLQGLHLRLAPLPPWPGPPRFRAPFAVRAGFLTGYRSRRSLRSGEAWYFANRLAGLIWSILGGVLLAVSVAVGTLFLRDNEDVIGFLVIGQALLLLLSISVVELSLRRHFDSAGRWIG